MERTWRELAENLRRTCAQNYTLKLNFSFRSQNLLQRCLAQKSGISVQVLSLKVSVNLERTWRELVENLERTWRELVENFGRTCAQNYTLKPNFSFRSQNLLLSAIDDIIPNLILENPELTMSKPNSYPIHARVDSPKSGIAEIAHL